VVKVEDADSDTFDVSDDYFSILPSSTSIPFLTLTSPNGGEKWTVGETHNITWEAEGIGSVNLYLEIPGDCVNDEFDNPICYPGTSYDIATSVSASSGSYSWTIPSRGISTGDSSVVKVEDADSDTFDVSDDYFSISSEVLINPVSFQKGWNLFSPSVQEGIDISAMEDSGCSISAVYSWNPVSKSYSVATGHLNAGTGYWVAEDGEGCTFSVPGTPWYFSKKHYEVGTYLIGSAFASVSVSDVLGSCPPEKTTVKTQSGFGSIYQETSTMLPFKAYWLQLGEACDFGAEPVVPVPALTLTSPNGGEKWEIGKTYNITWESAGINKIDKIYYWSASGDITSIEGMITQNISANLGKYLWTIPSNVSLRDNYKIRVWTSMGMLDDSNNYFSIVSEAEEVDCTDSDEGKDYYTKGIISGLYNDNLNNFFEYCENSDTIHEFFCVGNGIEEQIYQCPYGCKDGACQLGITLTSPNGGEKWTVGETHNITWEAEGIGSVNLYLEIPGDCVNDEFDNPICYPGTSYDIATSVSASSGSYSWTIPSRGISTGDSSVVKVEDADSDTFDVSDDYFSILPSSTYYFNGLDLEVKSMENQLASIAAFLSQLLNEIRELMDR
jgi:hypothetical protein